MLTETWGGDGGGGMQALFVLAGDARVDRILLLSGVDRPDHHLTHLALAYTPDAPACLHDPLAPDCAWLPLPALRPRASPPPPSPAARPEAVTPDPSGQLPPAAGTVHLPVADAAGGLAGVARAGEGGAGDGGGQGEDEGGGGSGWVRCEAGGDVRAAEGVVELDLLFSPVRARAIRLQVRGAARSCWRAGTMGWRGRHDAGSHCASRACAAGAGAGGAGAGDGRGQRQRGGDGGGGAPRRLSPAHAEPCGAPPRAGMVWAGSLGGRELRVRRGGWRPSAARPAPIPF